MKKLLIFLLLFTATKFLVHSQTNFYTLMDSLYQNNPRYSLPDSSKSGGEKDFDRIKLLLGPRLYPHGDFSVATNSFQNYVDNFNQQTLVPSACATAIPATWKEEAPFDKAGMPSRGNNGQINRILYDPNYNLTMPGGSVNKTIYAGSFHGGLWKTTDDGLTWSSLTDSDLPQNSIAGIAVSHQNSDDIFIATGNGDAFNLRDIRYSGTGNGIATSIFSSGIYRSRDGGVNWQIISPNFNQHFPLTNYPLVDDIVIDPNNPNNLYIPTHEGILKSTNALSQTPTWSKLVVPSNVAARFSSIKFHPVNNNLYAASDEIITSSDGGLTWSSLTGSGQSLDFSQLPNSFQVLRIKLAVTEANADNLYAYIIGTEEQPYNSSVKRVQSRYIFKRKNNSWQQVFHDFTGPAVSFSEIVPQYMGFAVSPTHEDMILYGSVVFRAIVPSTYYPTHTYGPIHHDIHDIMYEPNSTDTYPDFIVGSHGGITQSYDLTGLPPSVKAIRNQSNNINTSMLWGMDISEINNNHIIMGRQDMGTHESTDKFNSWTLIEGTTDGYGVGYADENILPFPTRIINPPVSSLLPTAKYPTKSEYVIANQSKTSNKIFNTYVTSNFKSKYVPSLNRSIVGFDDLWSDYDPSDLLYPYNRWKIQSDIYSNIPFSSTSYRRVMDFEVAKSNPDYVYVLTTGKNNSFYSADLHRSVSGLKDNVYNFAGSGLVPKFSDISANLPQFIYQGTAYQAALTSLAVSKTNHQHLWISLSGYFDQQKVYESTDGGMSWVNADPSGCLPNLPANAIAYQDGTNDRLYLAMDNGVYVSEGTGSARLWKKMGDLPNVMTHQLIINECSNRLYAGTYGRGIWSAELLPTDNEFSAQEITTPTTWSEDRIVSGNILVTAPNKLTITSTIYMGANSKIIVEPNAILEIDGGTLTNSCGQPWHGIVLDGDNSQNQLPLTHPLHQAKLELKNGAVLDNVQYGITFRMENKWNNFGGLVYAEDATIRCTRRAVEFMKYPHNNNSYFKRCTFEYMTSIQETPLSLVTLWENKGVNFYGCTFRDETGLNVYSESTGNGIFSADAAYQVLADCNDPAQTSPCNPQYLTRSSFSNFNQGVFAMNTAGVQHTITVDQADFTDNSIACRIEGVDNIRFTRNTVLGGGIIKSGYITSTIPHQYGFFSESAHGFEVEQNTFESRANPVENVAGLKVDEAGIAAEEVYNNTFKNNTAGQIYRGRNRNYRNAYEGLQFLCNNNPISNSKDVIIDPDLNSLVSFSHGVRDYQGTTNPAASAANLFSATTQVHLENNTQNTVTYYYNGSAEQPTVYTPGLVIPTAVAASNACAVKYLVQTPRGVQLKPNMLADYYTDYRQYRQLLYNYKTLIDGGDTEMLLQSIGLSTSSEAIQLRDELMAEAPYLSEEALRSAAESGILTDELLLEVCLANPDATRNEGFLDLVEFEIPNPLPANMVQLIYLNWETETPRTLLENELADKNADLGRRYSQVLHFYAQDSLDHADSIKSLLENQLNFQAKYSLAELAIEQADFHQAELILTEIVENERLDEAEAYEHLNFYDYLQFRAALHAAERDYFQLQADELQSLRSIADKESGRSATLARSILCFAYGECSGNTPQSEGRKKARRLYDMTLPPAENSRLNIQLHPNPAGESTTLFINDPENREDLAIQLINLQGKKVLYKQISTQQTEINLSHLPKASYLYQVLQNGKAIKKGTLVIQ